MQILLYPSSILRQVTSLLETNGQIHFSDAKTQKVAQAILGALSFFVAYSLGGYRKILALLTLPVYLIGFKIAHSFFFEKGYNSEEKLHSYRQKALKESLEQTLRLHGLKNLIHYNILLKDELAHKLKMHLTKLKPEAIALFYIELKKEIKDTTSYRAIFQEAMREATRNIKASALFENPQAKSILTSDLFSKDFKKAADQYQELKEIWIQNCKIYRKQFTAYFQKDLERFKTQLISAVAKEEEAQNWICSILQDIPKLKAFDCAAEAQIETTPLLQECGKSWSSIQFLIKAHKNFLTHFHKNSEQYRKQISRETRYFKKCTDILDQRFI